MTKGLISVIVPVYNGQDYLDKCLKSIMFQTYQHFEVILVDDGSTDKSGKICDKYARENKNIKVVHKKNAGPAAARNDGIKISRGELVFFIDADDYLEKNAFEVLVAGYGKTGADLVVGDFQKIRNDKPESRNDILLETDKLLEERDIVEYARWYLRKPNKYLLLAFSWARIFKSSIIRKYQLRFDERLHTFEDVAFNFDYLKYTRKVFFVKKVIYSHLVYDNLLSATTAIGSNPERLLGYKQALKSAASFLKKKIEDREINKEVGQALVTLTIIQLVRNCAQINNNEAEVQRFVRRIVDDFELRNSLKYYRASKGESRIIPLLIKLRLAGLIILVGKYKAYKRYKNGKA